MDNRAIGIFDSGLGGLTAACELSRLLPMEHIIYLGDSHNMPYGEKTHEQIVEMSRQNLYFVLEKKVKAVFVACGTITSNALDILIKESPVPVFGVIDASVMEAAKTTKNNKIGLLATTASVAAGAFQKRLQQLAPKASVTVKACPKFASMVEDGLFDKHHPAVRSGADEYLPSLKAAGVDTVILGCTHYPLLAEAISEYMGSTVKLISSGAAAARRLSTYLKENNLCSESEDAVTEYYTTGSVDSFANTARLMLGRDISRELTGISPFSFDKRGNI